MMTVTAILLCLHLPVVAQAADGNRTRDLAWLTKTINRTRDRVHHCQDTLGVHRSPVGPRSHSARYLKWALTVWRARERAYCGIVAAANRDPRVAIRVVYGRHADEALLVAGCESRFDLNARNGQYQGLFQMGEWERRTFGHGSTALEQAQAAHRYFVLSGWRPWECARIEGVI